MHFSVHQLTSKYEYMERKESVCSQNNCICICLDGVVIAAQCTATFLRSIVLPEFRY